MAKKAAKKPTRRAPRKPVRVATPGKPTQNIRAMALHALADNEFRQAGSKPNSSETDNFGNAIRKALQGGASFRAPTPQEKEFCEGWLYCVREQLGDEFFDEKLLIAIKQHIRDDKLAPVSG